MSEHLVIEVPPGAAGSRLDRFVADASGLSRSAVQRHIAEGRLTLAGARVRARDPVQAGWVLELEVPEVASDAPEAEDIPLRIVYEDDDILVIDKPAGLVTHPAPGHESGTLVNALLALAAQQGRGLGSAAGPWRPGIVHRLDRDTSGLLIVARSDAAQVAIQAQLKARRVRKTYQALVAGSVDAQVGRIEKPIGRDPRDRRRMAVVAEGRPATTGYRVRERFGQWTLLELDLVTGRTHQLRVHLASIGHAVAGDPVYATGLARRGPDGLARLFLHAWKLELVSPLSGRLVRCEAPLPDELEGVLATLRAEQDGEGLTIRSISGQPGAQLVIISGPSGVGKDTIIEAMQRRTPQHPRRYVITVTTRARRPAEVAGVSYHFLSLEDYERLRDGAGLLEASEVHGNWYGTPRDQVQAALSAGHDAILKIDVQGARKVHEAVPGALTIFVVPPSLEALQARLVGRSTESREDLERRRRDAAHELTRQGDYDHVVVNEDDRVDETAERIDAIIAAEHERFADRRIVV